MARISAALLVRKRMNKCTNFNANPTDLTNVTAAGDGAAVLSVVDDTVAIAAGPAEMRAVCSSGQVYKLDNTSGVGTADARMGGVTGNTAAHSFSVYWRGTGQGRFGYSNGVTTAEALPADFVRKTQENVVVDTAARFLLVRAQPGAVVFFILNQMEEGAKSTLPPIVTRGAAGSGI